MNNNRTVPGPNTMDPAAISSIQYNDAAGSQKVSEVGIHPLPFPFISGGVLSYKTNLTTTPLPLPRKGMGLAVYNNSAAVHSITLGESAAAIPTALAAGVTDAAGHVGIPCTPNTWTYIATGLQNWVIADSALLLVFIISDNTTITNQTPAQVPNY